MDSVKLRGIGIEKRKQQGISRFHFFKLEEVK